MPVYGLRDVVVTILLGCGLVMLGMQFPFHADEGDMGYGPCTAPDCTFQLANGVRYIHGFDQHPSTAGYVSHSKNAILAINVRSLKVGTKRVGNNALVAVFRVEPLEEGVPLLMPVEDDWVIWVDVYWLRFALYLAALMRSVYWCDLMQTIDSYFEFMGSPLRVWETVLVRAGICVVGLGVLYVFIGVLTGYCLLVWFIEIMVGVGICVLGLGVLCVFVGMYTGYYLIRVGRIFVKIVRVALCIATICVAVVMIWIFDVLSLYKGIPNKWLFNSYREISDIVVCPVGATLLRWLYCTEQARLFRVLSFSLCITSDFQDGVLSNNFDPRLSLYLVVWGPIRLRGTSKDEVDLAYRLFVLPGGLGFVFACHSDV